MLIFITYLLVAFNLGFILATQFSLKAIECQLKIINSTLNGQLNVAITPKKETLAELHKKLER